MRRKILGELWEVRSNACLQTGFKAFALTFIIALVGSASVAFLMPRVYSSTAIVVVSSSDPSNPHEWTTRCKIIKSYSVLTNVIDALHLDDRLSAQAGALHWTMDQTYAALYDAVSAERIPPKGIAISVTNRDSKLAANIANAIAVAYLKGVEEQRQSDFWGGMSVLEAQLRQNEERVATMKTNLNEMRAELGISNTNEAQAQAESPRPPEYQRYFSLKDQIDELRSNNQDLSQTIQRGKAEVQIEHPRTSRDYARPSLRPVRPSFDTFLSSLFGGTVIALFIGSVGACVAYLLSIEFRQPDSSQAP